MTPTTEEVSSAEDDSPASSTPVEGTVENGGNGADDSDEAAENAVEGVQGADDTTAAADEGQPSEATEAVALDEKPEVESDVQDEEGSKKDKNESEEPTSPSEENEKGESPQAEEGLASPAEDQYSPISEEETVQVVAAAVQREPASEPSSDKDTKETESGPAEEDSLEEPAKATVAGMVTETASSISSADNRDVEKDSHTVGSQDSDPNAAATRRNRQASSMSQILALIRKNILTKLRTPGATFFELFSPVLMMLVLSAAYTLTDIEYEDAETYASLNLAFPGPWIDLAQRSTSIFPGGNNMDIAGAMGRRRKLKRSTRGEDPNLLVQMNSAASKDDEPKTWDGILEGLQQKLEQVMLQHTHEIVSDEMDQSHNRRLQTFRNNVDTSLDAEVQSYELLDDARDEVSTATRLLSTVLGFKKNIASDLYF